MTLDSNFFLELFQAGQHETISNIFTKSRVEILQDPASSKIVAASLFSLGLFQESYSILRGLESCYGHDPEFLSLFGICSRRLGQFDEAKKLLAKALELQPDSLAIQNNYANTLIDLGLYAQAEQGLLEILKLNPHHSDAQINLSRLKELQKSGNNNANLPSTTSKNIQQQSIGDPLLLAFSDEEITRSNQPRPRNDTANELKIAADQLRQVLPEASAAELSADYLKLANKAVAESRFDFALSVCTKAKKLLNTSPIIYDCAADAYIGLKDFAKAEACLLHCVALGHITFKTCANLISILCIKKDWKLAEIYLQKAIKIDGNNSNLKALARQIADLKAHHTNEFVF